MFELSKEVLQTISGGQTCEVIMTASSESFTSINKDQGDCEVLQLQYENGFYDKIGEKWINAGFEYHVVIKPLADKNEL